jgi:glycosyltransferase involved in cell wall biosynthesis
MIKGREMYQRGLVSIVMPAHNCEAYIHESIQSVLSQSYIDWELIIVNDFSSDNTLDIISTFEDPRIHIISNSSNRGVAETRNTAIGIAKGQYIAFLDSDDLWLPEKLSKQISALQSDDNAVCSHSSFSRINASGELLCYVTAIKKINLSLMRKSNFIGNLTGIIDRNKVNTIVQKNVKHEDYIMWLDVLSNRPNNYSIGITEVLAKYRVCNISISSNKLQSIIWHWSVLRKEQGLRLFSAIYYLAHYIYYGIKKRQ